MLWLCLVGASALAGEMWFYPGPGEATADLVDGRLGGVPVALTGALLAESNDPLALQELPEVIAVEVRHGTGRVARLRLAPGVDELALARALHGRADVHWSHPDFRIDIRPHALPDDPMVGEQWHLQNTGQRDWTPGADIDAESAWAITGGAGQLIAIIDSGIDLEHPDLKVIPGHDYIDDDEDPSPEEIDGFPHGTAVGGLAGATGNNGLGVTGVAYEAELYAIRLIGGSTTLTDTYDAFIEATNAGATVLNNSWGFGDDCSDFMILGSLLSGIDYAEREGRGGLGSAFVASAGNGNCDISDDPFQRHPPVISVAAINGDDRKEGYSNFGDLIDISAPAGVLTTDVTGPRGYEPWDDDPDYTGWFNGTSSSAPIVSGVLALMFAANERLTAADAREILCLTAARNDLGQGDYDELGWSPLYGCGRVDAGAAVTAVANTAPDVVLTNPPPEVVDGREVLRWDGLDIDGDTLHYKVRWWPTGHVKDEQTLVIDDPFLDLSEELGVGDSVTWKVRGIDLWGNGPWTEEQQFAVVEVPKPPKTEHAKGCAFGALPVAGGAWMVLMAVAVRRRP